MPLIANWADTPTYKEHIANNPDDSFVNDEGYPKFPINCLIWLLLPIQIGQITEENAHKVFARLSLYLKVLENGYIGRQAVNGKFVGIPLTPEHIKCSVGLSLNANTEPDTKWVKHFLSIVKRENAEPIDGIKEWTTASVKSLAKKYEAEYLASVDISSTVQDVILNHFSEVNV